MLVRTAALFSKDARLSADVIGNVLNLPLYDADCCPAARQCLAVGDVAGAIAAWRRLADLGSGSARCVLACVHLMGAPSIPADPEEARRLALSGMTGARGYANYLLGCIALREKKVAESAKYFVDAFKAGFMPAAIQLASLSIRGASAERKQQAVNLLHKAAAAGDRPALLNLAQFYISGDVGFTRRLVGLALFIPAYLRVWLALRYQIFSIHCFYCVPGSTPSLFNDDGIRRLQQGDSVTPNVGNRTIIRCTHTIAALVTAVVLVRQSGQISGHSGMISPLAMAGWALAAAWPFGLSYLLASILNARRPVSTWVQSLLLCLITTLGCSEYLGQLLDSALSVWVIAETTVTQAFVLFLACGYGELAAQQVEEADRPIARYRPAIAWAHLLLGVAAAGSCLANPLVWRLDLSEYGFNVASLMLLAALPYLVAAVLSLRQVTTNPWKPWVYVATLIGGTALAVFNNSGIWVVQPGLLGIGLVLMVQFIGFVLAAEWAMDGTEW